jgi:organic radical activating enzyme
MQIISVDNNWDPKVLRIDINLGNICNHKCWYCWPNSNAGTDYWPDVEILKKNIVHLIRYYETHAGKKVFDFHFVGGEPTHWPKLLDFVKFLKTNFNCLTNMTSNGSKKMAYWQEIAPYFDRVHMSCHHEFVKIKEFRDICDMLYEKNVMVSVAMMMDTFAWDKCMDYVEFLKKSRRRWTIKYVEIIDPKIIYNEEQKAVLKKFRARRCNIFWFWRNNKHYVSKTRVVDFLGKTHRFKDNEVLLKKMNRFHGWRCSVGVNWIHITNAGMISGTCGELLFGEDKNYNIYSPNFEKEFNPQLVYATCSKHECLCDIETIMPKYQDTFLHNKKVIPIYAN